MDLSPDDLAVKCCLDQSAKRSVDLRVPIRLGSRVRKPRLQVFPTLFLAWLGIVGLHLLSIFISINQSATSSLVT